MSRVYDDMRRAAKERGNTPIDAPAEPRETEPAAPEPDTEPPHDTGAAGDTLEDETRERLDALQVSLSALEDRLADEEAWQSRGLSDPPPGSRSRAPLERIDWSERVAQLEVSVHALEDQLERPPHRSQPTPAEPPVPSPPSGRDTERAVRRLELQVETLRARVDQSNLRQNLLTAGLVVTLLYVYAC